MAVHKIALIIGSTRTIRVGPSVVNFVHKTILSSNITPVPSISIVDIGSFGLPVFDEPAIPAQVPAQGSFIHAHSVAWSAEISKYDAYIFVSPEYNYGIPGGIKNAIDYLHNEWIGRPAMIITYGAKGGQSANRNLNETLTGMKLRVAETSPELQFGGEGMEDTFKAAGGVLGEDTLKLWEETKEEDVVKAFGELMKLLKTPFEDVKEPAH
ncbi:putative NAD(P)H-dependent FMN reductase LOT6 [Sclerotinia borealis F-4128]|uniref:Putative NAD(P)H-dependent FMN reductase LOT6 n=1 Tax=Sclerotinia borealis (strain F-4128) TaxID=1432307 RepID=W9CIR9_SCLBF|nr:putative NAD(P)H-dependent FMN reductase LOT6 [Sclerotinia borealis F-4128]